MIPLSITLPKNGKLTPALADQFKFAVYEYYKSSGRSFAWRDNITPYRVVVSEVMLQQTQTDRVVPKFDLFITEFPDFQTLAAAPFDHVLRFWKGLGYNRRAQALQKIARCVIEDHGGVLPDDPKILETFPGIGPATAAAVVTYAFNKPTVFIETNVRTVFIYTFFRNAAAVKDADLLPLIDLTVDRGAPRQWYYALMDYGVMLKKTVGNVSRLSAHYTKQSRFEGSDRQIRGRILQVLLDMPGIGQDDLVAAVAEAMAPRVAVGRLQGGAGGNDRQIERFVCILADLLRENFICQRGGGWWLEK